MGGNALKHMNPVRVTTPEAVAVYHDIARLFNVCGGLETAPVPWVESKTSHGDIDILVFADLPQVRAVVDAYQHATAVGDQRFNPGATTNDRCISAPYRLDDTVDATRVVQVDLMCVGDLPRPFVKLYYSGGDFGLYIGRVAAALGFVFAQEGLRIRADPGVPWMRDVLLTSDPHVALRFLGYGDPPRFRREEDLWAYVLSSPKAQPWMFLPHGTNAENRSRDKQRPAVQRFQEWLACACPGAVTAARAHLCFEVARRAWEAEHGDSVIAHHLANQERSWRIERDCNRAWGIEAVALLADRLRPDIDIGERSGDLILAMQPFLPHSKIDRLIAFTKTPELVKLHVQAAAEAAAHQLGWFREPPVHPAR